MYSVKELFEGYINIIRNIVDTLVYNSYRNFFFLFSPEEEMLLSKIGDINTYHLVGYITLRLFSSIIENYIKFLLILLFFYIPTRVQFPTNCIDIAFKQLSKYRILVDLLIYYKTSTYFLK